MAARIHTGSPSALSPAVVTAGGSATVSATVYSRSETDGEWSEYLGGGAVITWQAYREGVAAFRGEDADKPVTTALNAGSSSSSLELLTKAGGRDRALPCSCR